MAEVASLNYERDEEREYATIKTYDFEKNLEDLISNAISNVKLKPYDVITLREDPFFNLQKTVTIGGAVYFPGKYVITSSNESISDIIQRAGGLVPNANPKASTFTRGQELIKISYEKLLRNPRSKTNIKILPGDVINIGTFSDVVKVRGEVYNPGTFQYVKGLSFKNYIENAGGYTKSADKYRTYVVHADGSSEIVKLLNFYLQEFMMAQK